MMGKLDDLCAIKVMDWKLSSGIEMYSDGQWYTGTDEAPLTECQDYEWNPSTDLNNALVCLERATWGEGKWFLDFRGSDDEPYSCDCGLGHAKAKTAALAMCLCSLRAMGVPESEISLAMEN